MNQCIDAGGQGCPCALAESGNCLVCSKLNGGSCDDCLWQGACIYTLYHQNQRHLAEDRLSQKMNIEAVYQYGPAFRVFVVKSDRGFCQKAARAGAYVFVRAEDQPPRYDFPVSVLKAEPDKGLLHLGICECGPKTSKVFSSKGSLLIRGVYGNGLMGLSTLAEAPEAAAVFAKGIAMAPLCNFIHGGRRYTRYLKNLQVYVDLEKVGFDFFKAYFGDLPVDSIQVCSFAQENLVEKVGTFLETAKGPVNVFALTSPYYAAQIVAAAQGKKAAVVQPAEGNFCCGEGVCGACTFVDERGTVVRRCKAVR